MGKTIIKFRKNKYDEDDYSHRETKQKRKEKIESKRFENYSNDYYQYDPFIVKNKKFRKTA